MNRRSFLAIAAGAIAAPRALAASKPQPHFEFAGEGEVGGQRFSAWITIAGPGWTSNRRAYTEDSLNAMAKYLPGLYVNAGDLESKSDGYPLTMGQVRAARRIEPSGRVQVQMDWFRDVPGNMYLAPVGLAHCLRLSYMKKDNWCWIDRFAINSLILTARPAFRCATPIWRSLTPQ